jgi:small subunit ribosomal protein S8e
MLYMYICLFIGCLRIFVGMYHRIKTRAHKKKKRFTGGPATDTGIGGDSDVRKKARVRGGFVKERLVSAKYANVLVDGKSLKCEVSSVKDNPSSRDLTRRNIMTRGAVVEVQTPDGGKIMARVTSRPGQDGVLNAVKV